MKNIRVRTEDGRSRVLLLVAIPRAGGWEGRVLGGDAQAPEASCDPATAPQDLLHVVHAGTRDEALRLAEEFCRQRYATITS